MTEYLLIAVAAAAACWYCRRWGHADGHAEGYEAGRNKGLLEGAGVVQSL